MPSDPPCFPSAAIHRSWHRRQGPIAYAWQTVFGYDAPCPGPDEDKWWWTGCCHGPDGFDVGDGMSAVEHVHCPAMTKGMHGIYMLESLRRKRLFQILSADTINAMSGEFFAPLTDK